MPGNAICLVSYFFGFYLFGEWPHIEVVFVVLSVENVECLVLREPIDEE